MLIRKNDKIIVPMIIRKDLVNCYHKYLLHTGTERTAATADPIVTGSLSRIHV